MVVVVVVVVVVVGGPVETTREVEGWNHARAATVMTRPTAKINARGVQVPPSRHGLLVRDSIAVTWVMLRAG